MRLIDADRLIAECKEVIAQEWNHKAAPVSWAQAYEVFVDSLETAPAVDAVEVVRCRDCKLWEKIESSLLGEVMCCTGQGDVKIKKAADDFCSYGERRNE